MDEQQIINIAVMTRIITLDLAAIGACIYAMPLCFIQQFHKLIHLLSLNVCITTFICTNLWLIFYTMNKYYSLVFWTAQSCLPIIYLQNMVNCQLFYAAFVVSVNRLFTIVYKNKRLFQTERRAGICVSAQCIFGALTPLPILFSNSGVI